MRLGECDELSLFSRVGPETNGALGEVAALVVVEIPEELRQATVQREGGAAWLASLPTLLDELLQRWNCVPDGPAAGGKVGIVQPAKSSAYGDVVLKVSHPHPANAHEPDAYRTWAGHGAVLLWERDDECLAMLLERVGPERPYEVLPVDEAIRLAGVLVRRLAVPAPPRLPRVSDWAAEWADIVDRATGRLHARVVDAARDTVRDLCRRQPDTMVHGDLHLNNVLRGVREPWQVIDPRGWVGDPAFDCSTLLRTTAVGGRAFGLISPEEFEPAVLRWLALFAEAAELDREHVRRWAQVRAVVRAQQHFEWHTPQSDQDTNDHFASILTPDR
ncbi:streptomycin 6-kinase [Actinopolymorpha cephalotaxi]|uniref:Streptomycin 6-kinase n=1 Tax=Actinopolymorpha cephalotaxi TaxID=504797 RepID=A0A1I2WTQ5_9ACTN|nr:aminoglycoside phosphotransferase family protein [Actinopolymorpha cephalotaxi]NYH85094.1 streptomycin 6-kinase [Actinopolymorpha cephalotaxi]SFH03969.1 streptomycin 6-kinase [Actinopolymorpha cephalotaxi]